jgi:V/A-type H+-transporting ATPase subunit E
MALEDIIKTLEVEYEQKVTELEKENKFKLQQLKIEGDKKITTEKEKILQTFTQANKRKVDLELFVEKSKLRSQVLEVKRDLLNKVYETVLKKISKLPDQEHEKLLDKLLSNLPSVAGLIVPAKGREKVTNQALKKLKIKHKLAIESLSVAGGFLWQGDDFDIDLTVEKLVESIKSKTEIEVTKKIFS